MKLKNTKLQYHQFTYLLFYLFVSNAIYYVEVENGALLREIAPSWKMILGGHRRSHGKFLGKKCGNHKLCILLIVSAEKIVYSFVGKLSRCAVGNVEWNSAEIERFQRAVVEYDKDFMKISQHVSINI